MFSNLETAEISELKLRIRETSLDNQRMILEFEETDEKYLKILQKNKEFEEEINRLKSSYEVCLTQAHARESSLTTLLESKELCIAENLAQVMNLKQNQARLVQEKNMLEEEINMIYSLDLSSNSQVFICDCDKSQKEFAGIVKNIDLIGKV